jgi:hypothetical protein
MKTSIINGSEVSRLSVAIHPYSAAFFFVVARKLRKTFIIRKKFTRSLVDNCHRLTPPEIKAQCAQSKTNPAATLAVCNLMNI